MDLSFDDLVARNDRFSDEEAEGRQPKINNEDEEDNNHGEDKDAKVPAKNTRRVIRNPQPKLNPERLCGTRGIIQLPKIFEDVTLKGKGHEKEDLDKVLKTMEHWSHRLFPKFSFDDALDRIQKLGTKKPVQACLNKIRMDIISTWDDEITEEVEDDNHAKVAMATEEDDDRFDRLHASIFGEPSTSQRDAPTTLRDPAPVTPAVALTDNQRAKIEESRRLATERLRSARLLAISARNNPKLSENEQAPPVPLEAVAPAVEAATEMDNQGRTSQVTDCGAQGSLLSTEDIMTMMEVDFDAAGTEAVVMTG